MKKHLLVLFCALTLVLSGSMAFANGASVETEVRAAGGAIDVDAAYIPNGSAFGISGAGGFASGDGSGEINNGVVGLSEEATAGGFTNTEAYTFGNYGPTQKSIGVGVYSHNKAVTGGSVDANIFSNSPNSRGSVGGGVSGAAAQGSLSVTRVEESPLFFSSTGETSGVAAQGSAGAFSADVDADTDDHRWCPPAKDPTGGYGITNAGAEIEMFGGSYSQSERFVQRNGLLRTEGMVTTAGANTDIYATKHRSWSGSLGAVNEANVSGGYVAGGIVNTETTQQVPNGVAEAGARGSYFGCGPLNSQYHGYADGYTATHITTHDYASGSIVNSAASMRAGSEIDRYQGNDLIY